MPWIWRLSLGALLIAAAFSSTIHAHPGAAPSNEGAACVDPQREGAVFQNLRYDDAFCQLAPAPDDPWWFGLKNLGNERWSLSIGGEVRMRAEQFSPVRAGLRGGVDDTYLTYRVLTHADVGLGLNWRVFAQVGYWEGHEREPAPARTDIDHGDVQQLFVEWRSDAAFVRVGRQEVLYGSGKLIGLRRSPNIRLSFEGARVGMPLLGGQLEAFHLRPLDVDPQAWHYPKEFGEKLQGFYFQQDPPPGQLGMDSYLFEFSRAMQRYQNGAGPDKRVIAGLRLFGEIGKLELNSEVILQRGETGAQSARAWSWQNDFTYRRNAVSPWAVGIKVNAASGDGDPTDGRIETFQPMYAAPPYYMQSALIAGANHANLQGYLDWTATENFTLTGEVQANWRVETADGFYQPSLVVQPLDARGHFTGMQVGLSLEWAASHDLSIEAWTSKLYADGPLRRAGAVDATFFAAMVTYSF